MGTQTWVCITIIITEVLICLKFDWETVTKPFPPDIALYWSIFGAALLLWTIWQFCIRPFLFHKNDRKAQEKKD